MVKSFYITTTTPYVNSDPHLGYALEIVQADILSRFHKLLGEELFFNTGTDEHGMKIYRKAAETGREPQTFVDGLATRFKALLPVLDILPEVNFIRTTDTHHKQAVQEFWRRSLAAGDIYKKQYEVKYCVGCELEKTDSELENGVCPIHPNLVVETISEENYFFRFSKYQNELLSYYYKNPTFVVPDFRFNEIKKFVEGGLQDFSVSRLKEKMPWGVPVPDDETQVMYVWFDALVNYISALGWPENSEQFEKFWGTVGRPNGVQIAGKDNLRQQSAMWQAMLFSAGLPNTKQVIIHGFINSGGQKMSKSLGNVVDPFEVVEKYGTDALRYWLVREMNTFEDGDFTWEKFKESYNANLANGLGNLTSRILKMAVNAQISNFQFLISNFNPEYSEYLDKYEIQKAADWIWAKIKAVDEFIAKEEPFKKVKVNVGAGKKDIEYLLQELASIGFHLQPFLPESADKILVALQNISQDSIPRLFPRVE